VVIYTAKLAILVLEGATDRQTDRQTRELHDLLNAATLIGRGQDGTSGLIYTVSFVMVHAVSLYLSFEKTTSLTLKHQLKMTFPAVTICNNNAVMLNKLLKNEELSAMVYGTSDAGADADVTTSSKSADGITTAL